MVGGLTERKITMTFAENSALAARGDKRAFAEISSSVSRQMYFIAYYTLKTRKDAEKAVMSTLNEAFSKYVTPQEASRFCAVLIKLLSARIIARLKEYKVSGVVVAYDPYNVRPDENGLDLKQEFNRLTDLERLCMSIWAVSAYSEKEISVITGIREDVVEQKLESAEKKLTAKIYRYL